MNIDDGDDDKLKKARMVSLYNFKDRIFVLVIIGVICLLVLMITSYSKRSNNNNSLIELHNAYTNTERRVAAPMNIRKIPWEGCLYELPTSKDEIVPKHIVPPPLGDVTLVCCNTTKGVLNIEVHPTWAPRGADRFLSMVVIHSLIEYSIIQYLDPLKVIDVTNHYVVLIYESVG